MVPRAENEMWSWHPDANAFGRTFCANQISQSGSNLESL